jgi:2-(1,2-epoxy-1,2-dihydrophenyl)acetyl-CoA isomerase
MRIILTAMGDSGSVNTHGIPGEQPILVSESDGITVVTLNRPHRRNALNVATVSALTEALVAAEAGHAVILTGSGTAFCAGGDLVDIGAAAAEGATAVVEMIYGPFHHLVSTLDRLAVPVVAAVNGACLGAGLDLMLCSDLRVASSDASFASSWIRMGLVPGMGGARSLVQSIGSARAAELLLSGEPITAQKALDWGLVNDVRSPEALMDHALERCRRLAALPRAALKYTRSALRRSLNAGLQAELDVLGATQGALLTHEDFAAAVAEFRSSRA